MAHIRKTVARCAAGAAIVLATAGPATLGLAASPHTAVPGDRHTASSSPHSTAPTASVVHTRDRHTA